MTRSALFSAAFAALFLAVGPAALHAQGVTTAAIGGTVHDAEGAPRQGVRVVALHEPSGTRYETRSRQDGRFALPGMRVGGPYRVTASAIGFQTHEHEAVFLQLGQTFDIEFVLRPAVVQLSEVTVTAEGETVFSSARTGAATSVTRETIDRLPSVTGRIEDLARLTPQYSPGPFGFTFAGQDNRLNNITVDGSYFNNSFGLAGQPGDRTNVAPISLGAIEQLQINVAPYDVRQGNFVGAGVNTVTRSGTNQFRGTLNYAFRDERKSMHGRDAGALTVDPGAFNFKRMGAHVGGPIIRDRLFFFFSYEDDELGSPATTMRANTGTQDVGGNITRVLASDLDALSSFLSTNFGYETGGYQGYEGQTPATRLLTKIDFNLSPRNKVSVRYNRLDSSTDVLVSNSSSLGVSGNRRTPFTDALNFRNSNYKILENIRSVVGEVNTMVGDNMANNFLIGRSEHDESRGAVGQFFPFVDILQGNTTYTSFGFEPFTPNNELRYKSTQLQNNFTRYGVKHDITIGGSVEWYESENVFFQGAQSVYTYSSLADFYTDANDFLANPNRTTSPITLRRFQVAWVNIAGMEKPIQPLEVRYAGVYLQDQWRVRDNVRLTLGLRADQPSFTNTAFHNSEVDGMRFRDEHGQTVQYSTKKMPDANVVLSPRLGFNWDVTGDRTTQVRGGSGVFSGRPAYVWISNQIGNNGLLTGFQQLDNTTARPFHPNPDHYKPATVADPPVPASSYALALTEPSYKFPQLWRTNVAVDRRLPFGFVGTAEFLYNRDVNGVYYINANLAPPNTSFTGIDKRPRWTAGNRINSNISSAVVLKNQNVGRSWNAAGSLERQMGGLFVKTAYSYGVAKNTVDPGSIAFGSWNNNHHAGDPNNPGLGFSANSPGHRFFLATTYRREYFRFGATTLGLFFDARTIGNFSYTFAGDINGDGGGSNDLIYIPRNTAEMNFQTYTQSAVTRDGEIIVPARTFTAAEQAAAWEAFIQQDSYLRRNRGKYAERNGVLLPMVRRADFSIAQEVFTDFLGQRNGLEIRADILNVGNMLNKNWGVSQRLVTTQPLLAGSPVADPVGRLQYRLRNRTVENEHRLISTSFEKTGTTGDVFRVLLGLRYTFN